MKKFFDNTDILLCSCGSHEHQIIIHKDIDDDVKSVSIHYHLTTYRNIFKRMWIAIKYVFGYKCKYGEWDSIIIDENNYKPLKDVIDFIENNNLNDEKEK